MARANKPKLLEGYVSLLWKVMTTTGKGYKRHSLRHTGLGDDRRKDKLQETQVEDDEGNRKLEYVERTWPESKLERKARLGQIGLRHV